MSDWTLRLTEDRLAGGGWLAFDRQHRVLYVLEGETAVTHAGTAGLLAAGSAWHGAGQCSLTTSGHGARVLRYELLRAGTAATPEWPGVASHVLLEEPLALDPAAAYLMRCDRVEFAPGGEAFPHGHKGGGIRYLLAGSLEVRIAGHPGRLMKPGDAWFESGAEPVHAVASNDEPTSFVRVSILPRAIRGQSSIVYVDPAHASVKPRTYTVYVDEPVDLS